MNAQDSIATVVSSGLSLMGLVWLFFWLYRDYRRDLFRARLFSLRADLFDGAADGRISFDHPAYGLLRSTFNGFLRFGHRFGTLRMIAMALVLDREWFLRDGRDFDRRWREALRTLDPEQRDWLSRLRNEMHKVFFRHLLATSLFGCLVFLPWIFRRENGTPQSVAGQTNSRNHLALTDRIDSVALAQAVAC